MDIEDATNDEPDEYPSDSEEEYEVPADSFDISTFDYARLFSTHAIERLRTVLYSLIHALRLAYRSATLRDPHAPPFSTPQEIEQMIASLGSFGDERYGSTHGNVSNRVAATWGSWSPEWRECVKVFLNMCQGINAMNYYSEETRKMQRAYLDNPNVNVEQLRELVVGIGCYHVRIREEYERAASPWNMPILRAALDRAYAIEIPLWRDRVYTIRNATHHGFRNRQPTPIGRLPVTVLQRIMFMHPYTPETPVMQWDAESL